jgi:hypothetical protein
VAFSPAESLVAARVLHTNPKADHGPESAMEKGNGLQANTAFKRRKGILRGVFFLSQHGTIRSASRLGMNKSALARK